MATRSEILIKTKDGKSHKFYHHWDGYPWGVGYDLVEKILNDPKAFDGFSALRKALTHDYEITDIKENHTDTEFFYTVISNDTGISLTFKKRTFNADWSLEKKMFFMSYVTKYQEYMPEFLEIVR